MGKIVLLGPDEASWKQYIPNVASTHVYVYFEEYGFVKHHLDCSSSVKHTDKHQSFQIIIPKMIVEKEQLYEWVLEVFKE